MPEIQPALCAPNNALSRPTRKNAGALGERMKKVVTLISLLFLLRMDVPMASTQELDAQIAEAAAFFAGAIQGDEDVLLVDELDREKLDYSLQSLDVVSTWLAALRARGTQTDDSSAASIVWAGAYVGEVIKRCAPESYRWSGYEQYMSTQEPGLRKMIPYTFGTQFVLVSNDGAMTLPINKVVRFLEEGPENDLRFYATAECKPRK